ncbi:MAG: DUF4965 domain-containing protein, partial [Phycisphaerae bacterium]|nr:DUF4965 domain-containing protein [Phycisphaerae bacterium]
LEQAPANRARAHLTNLAFQSFLANTFWCETDDGSDHFSVWEGNYMYHNTLDVAYNLSLFFFAFWPDLLRMCLAEWADHFTIHKESNGAFMHHDMGRGMAVCTEQAYGHSMPVEESSNYLLLLQAYIHWTGDLKPVRQHVACIRQLARYLLWTDRDNSGFATAGTANTLDDAAPAMQSSHHQTYLAIKRVCALDAAADLLDRGGDPQAAEPCRLAAAQDVPKIEQAAWLSDHFAVCVDPKTVGVQDSWTGQAVPMDELKGWDDYSIHTANALLLPLMTAQPVAFDRDRLIEDMINAQRETMRPYGCAYTSSDQDHIRVSQNLWRDFIGRYLHVELEDLDSQYWDMQVAANTGGQSFGYTDAYVTGELVFHPRGVTAFGHLIAGPRLVVDRLDDHFIGVWPDRHRQQRWPLLPLADWAAGKIPVCVVDAAGEVSIEGEIEPVRVQGQAVVDESMIG